MYVLIMILQLFLACLHTNALKKYSLKVVRRARIAVLNNSKDFSSSTPSTKTIAVVSHDHLNANYKGTKETLAIKVVNALRRSFIELEGQPIDPMVTATSKPEFGDYQCNAAMVLAKKLKMKPRDVAEKLVASLQLEEIVSKLEIAGPGFINLHLSDSYVQNSLAKMSKDSSRLGIPKIDQPQKIIVDFSSPNIAKEMHVGHLRSTIIGDSIARILEFLGHDVVRLNHVGDWGTQFGMLINYLKENYSSAIENATGDTIDVNIGDLVTFYKAAKKRFDEDPIFQEASRNEVVKLQGGNSVSLRAWKAICNVSRVEFQKIYDLLAINVEERGESFYNPFLSEILNDFKSKNILQESEGAQCVFLPGYLNSDGSQMPLIIKKSDGGFLYATTDLAAIRHRIYQEKAERVLYITDIGQAQHFQMVFDAAKAVGYVHDDNVKLTHVPFGLVQGEDGKKFKSRSGDTVKLKDLLDEAIRLAGNEIYLRQQKEEATGTIPTTTTDANNMLAEDSNTIVTYDLNAEQQTLARVVGIGAVKYADLTMNRESNYRFSFKKMLSLNGNTAPYMLYSYVRIKGIQRKAAENLQTIDSTTITPTTPIGQEDFILKEAEEVALAKHIMRFEEVLREIESDLYPNKLCEYLFELSSKFNQFYERCPVIKAETKEIQKSRFLLCSLAADTIKLSLDLLGIKTVEKL